MKRAGAGGLSRVLSVLLVLGLVAGQSGCATIFRGTQQTVTLVTSPSGRRVVYQGVEVADGQLLTVQKHFEAPRVNVGARGSPVFVELQYDPDPLLIADAALLLVFIIPGVVALGIDFATGGWRNLHNPQIIYVPDVAAPIESP